MLILILLPALVMNVAVLILLRGLLLSKLWLWFLVPVLGIPAITAAQAVGIGLVVSFLLGKRHDADADKEIEVFRNLDLHDPEHVSIVLSMFLNPYVRLITFSTVGYILKGML